jgi:hypothetical protein
MTHFWEDTWLGAQPLATQYPPPYIIVRRKNVSVNDVLVVNPLNIEFQRVLVGNHFEIWLQLARKLMGVTLSTVEDTFTWILTNAGSFSVKSMYVNLMNGHTVFLQKYI